MNVLYRQAKENVLPRLEEELREQLSPETASRVAAFAQTHYSTASRSEMATKHPEEICHCGMLELYSAVAGTAENQGVQSRL